MASNSVDSHWWVATVRESIIFPMSSMFFCELTPAAANIEEETEKAFLFDWEVLIDSFITLPNDETIPIIFSRVYVEDHDLLSLGADEVTDISEELNKLKIQNINRQNFITKIENLGFISGFSTNMPKRSLNTSATEGEKRTCTIVDQFKDVRFETYKSKFSKNRCLKNMHRQETDENYDSNDDHSSALSSSKENCFDLSIKDKLNFDFGFDPKRDANLIAKNANKLMKEDLELMKYWHQRIRLFSKLNEGILMDREGWFSVTPERIAMHIADRMVTQKGMIILDGFTGVGGNAIQFAQQGAFVYALDLDPVKLRCAAHNARIYGVADKISFICTDFFHFVKSLKSRDGNGNSPYGIDAIFLSPPWGGPAYLKMKMFDLTKHITINGSNIFNAAKEISPNICYFLPRNTSIEQLISLAAPNGRVEIEQNMLNHKAKSISAYYGNLVASDL